MEMIIRDSVSHSLVYLTMVDIIDGHARGCLLGTSDNIPRYMPHSIRAIVLFADATAKPHAKYPSRIAQGLTAGTCKRGVPKSSGWPLLYDLLLPEEGLNAQLSTTASSMHSPCVWLSLQGSGVT